MTQTFRIEVSPNTVRGRDFVVILAPDRAPYGGKFVIEQTFVHAGGTNTLAGEMINEPIGRPVISDSI